MPRSSTNNISTLQIGHGWHPQKAGSGLDRVFYSLMNHFPEVGVDSQGLVLGDGTNGSSDILSAGPMNDFLPRRLLRIRRSYQSTLEPRSYDLVASHFALYALPVVDRLRSRSFVVHFHGPWARESSVEGDGPVQTEVKRQIEKLVYHRADRFIVLSDAFRKTLVEQYGVENDRVRTVPGGVDIERFSVNRSRRAAREELDWPQDRPIILAVRRLVRRVGLENLVEAMARVRSDVPDALLLIGGKGPLASTLDAQIQSSGLRSHVRLLGFVPDDELPLAYRAADFSVVPTGKLEGFGLVAVESLAAGTPVLVTPVGGLPEVVSDLSSDLVMRSPSVQALTEHLLAALNGTLSLPSSDACRNFAASRYDWRIIAQKVREVYEEVV